MGYRRLATVECGTLHQSFLLPECEARVAQGSDRIRSVAFHRPGRRNNLRLRTRIFRPLLQERRLPMHSVPHKGGSRSPEKENDDAQTELAGVSLFALNGHSVARACHQTPGNEGASQRGPAVRVQAAEHWKPFPAKKEQHRMGARVFAATCPIGICVSSGKTIASPPRFASVFATAQSRPSFLSP
jgi:hypothetical protein